MGWKNLELNISFHRYSLRRVQEMPFWFIAQLSRNRLWDTERKSGLWSKGDPSSNSIGKLCIISAQKT
jgi:hypothetical protein